MRLKLSTLITSKVLFTALAAALFSAPAILAHAAPQSNQNATTANSAQKSFVTPQAAAAALIRAAGDFDVAALKEILGPDGEDLVSSKDPVQDKNLSVGFAARAREKESVLLDPSNRNRAILSVGNDGWPLPIPIVKKAGDRKSVV